MEGLAMLGSLVSSLQTGFVSLANDLVLAIAQLAPVMIPVFGGLVCIGIVLKVVRRVVGR